MKGKINLEAKDLLKNLKKLNQNLQEIKFPVRHSQPISHTLI